MRLLPLLLLSSLALAGPNDLAPQFQTQIQNPAGTVVDPISRDWTLSSSTDSVSTVSNDLNASGSLTGLASAVTLSSANAIGSITLDIGGTFVGNITISSVGTYSSRTYYVQNSATSAIVGSVMSTGGNYRVVSPQGYGTYTVQFSSYTSGTANVVVRASVASNPFTMAYQLNAANLLASAWLSDGSGNALSSTTGSLNANVTASALPTGAATAALQATANASLASIDLGIPTTLGQMPMAASMPVAIASDQTAIPTTARSAITANAGVDISVNATSTAVLGANANRKGLILQNASSQQITIAFGGQTPVYQTGLTLLPGGVFNMDQWSFTTGAVNAITTGGAALLQVQEFQ
jgi:hypothetical protein